MSEQWIGHLLDRERSRLVEGAKVYCLCGLEAVAGAGWPEGPCPHHDAHALTAEPSRVEDSEVAHALVCLETLRSGSDFGKAFSADQLIDLIRRLAAAKASAEAFKAYVHQRLDDAGIPTHPDGEHSKAGCRIGDRLDIVLNAKASAERDAAYARSERMSENDGWKVADDMKRRAETAEAKLREARGLALEEAAMTCIYLRDANFEKLPHYEHEPDFSTEDVTPEDVCAWHIRALSNPE